MKLIEMSGVTLLVTELAPRDRILPITDPRDARRLVELVRLIEALKEARRG